MAVDLHVHSTASDGIDSPTRLMELAAGAGLTTVSLTDHDTFAGIDEAKKAAQSLGISFVPGVELSVDHDGDKMHMLVYFVDESCAELASRLAELRDGRDERNIAIVERLQGMGYEITMDDVRRHAGGPSVGRPHIADVLVEGGEFADRNGVFEHLLRDGGPAYVERPRLTAIEAIDIATRVGGVTVIAHPATISGSTDRYDEIFAELAGHGLGGIEAHHSMHSPALRHHLTEVAGALGIAATGGSDYHGAGVREYRLGVGTGDLRVPDDAVEELLARRG